MNPEIQNLQRPESCSNSCTSSSSSSSTPPTTALETTQQQGTINGNSGGLDKVTTALWTKIVMAHAKKQQQQKDINFPEEARTSELNNNENVNSNQNYLSKFFSNFFVNPVTKLISNLKPKI